MWDVGTEKEIARVTHNGPVLSVAFSWDGKYVVSRMSGGSIYVWEATSGREVSRLEQYDTGFQRSVAFSPDGKYIASGKRESILIWEVRTGNEYARIDTDSWVNSVAWSGDGKYIVSGSDDGTARVWYWQTKDLVTEICKRLSRNFTRVEWTNYIGEEPYRTTCSNLPPELIVTPTLPIELEVLQTPVSTATYSPTDTLDPSIQLININTASLAELDTLPGIDPTTAQRIIDYREQNGPFVKIEDIINVSGIGPAVYEGIKNLITVGP